MSQADELPRLREILREAVATGRPVTYRDLGVALGFEPPGTIRRVAALLEAAMDEDAAANRPFLAALAVSRAEGVPRRGFFERAAELGRFRGDPDGPEARDFFHAEYRAALQWWRAD